MKASSSIILAFLASAFPSIAQSDSPSMGTLIGQTSGDILNYECNAAADGNLTCDFTQVLLTSVADEADWAKMLSDLRGNFDDQSAEMEELCNAFMVPAARFVEDGMPSDISEYFPDSSQSESITSLSEVEREQFEGFVKLGGRFCETGNFEDLVGLMRFGFEQDLKTCKPFVNQYTQRYSQSTLNQWVVSEPPSGPCGIINTSRFTRNDGDGFLWSHTTSKVITNPSATTGGLFSCSELDETETFYDWRGALVRTDCEFVK